MRTTNAESTARRRQELLGELVAEHREAVLGYTRALVNDHFLAEDIVQETMLRAWNHTERLYSTSGSIRGWLLTVARNLAIDWRRSAATRHESVGSADRDVAEPDPADAVADSDEAVGLLRELSSEHRAVLVHTTMAGRTAVETARILGVPVGTVKSRQHYALNLLRARRVRPLPAR
ncbi:sigma-70 family RNA polymerase sigma factor [Actinoplanes solisilvae]|uniref:sigma-70 family RNA polymerase sigma factor n=1 Tax=Actinoplanes solisilvae TaxID=2486853 RepID=UPI000FD7A096|nr:sigma-70 family RNA polymerase sigma factor [Actinoplanes solisilvae]